MSSLLVADILDNRLLINEDCTKKVNVLQV